MDGFLFFDGLGLAFSGIIAQAVGCRLGLLYQAVGATLFGLLFISQGSVIMAAICAYATAEALLGWRGDDNKPRGGGDGHTQEG
jgi:hypothetical protein